MPRNTVVGKAAAGPANALDEEIINICQTLSRLMEMIYIMLYEEEVSGAR